MTPLIVFLWKNLVNTFCRFCTVWEWLCRYVNATLLLMLIKTDSGMHHMFCRLLAYKLIFLRLHWGAGTRKNTCQFRRFSFTYITTIFSSLCSHIETYSILKQDFIKNHLRRKRGSEIFAVRSRKWPKPITSKYPITKVLYLLFFCSCCCFLVISRHNMIPLQWGSSLFC